MINSFLKMHGEKVNVQFECFPIGVVAVDAVRVNVLLEQSTHG